MCLMVGVCTFGVAPTAEAAREAKGERPIGGEGEAGQGDYAANRLLERAEDLLLAQENERAVNILQSVIEQYPASPVRFKAYLKLGKHYLDRNEHGKAVGYLRNLKSLEIDTEGELSGEMLDVYLEGMYLQGVTYFEMRQYGAAFPILRRITQDHPNTVWANQGYYYIGMCHFAQENWNKAIKALSLVGTFVDPDSPSVQYVEAGHRFYVKVSDADLPVLHRLGEDIMVEVSTEEGDKEVVRCIPLASDADIFIGSCSSEIGLPKVGDNVLQMTGTGDISIRYVDVNTREGESNVPRGKSVKVVSTAAINFTLGTFENSAPAAFLGQPLFVMLHDVDLDTSPAADTAEVRIVSRYKQEEDDEMTLSGRGVDIDRLFREEEENYEIRDEVTLTLRELGEGEIIHRGDFGGRTRIEAFQEGMAVDKSDDVLVCALDDEIVASYVDERHIEGEFPRQVNATIKVIGEINSRPQATQSVAVDPVIKAKKGVVEATAYLELARIFKSMGLMQGAKEKAEQGLDEVEQIIRIREPIPMELKEDAFRIKWELHLVQDDFDAAIATCRLFNRLYPESPFVDQALLGIGKILIENDEWRDAINIFRQIIDLPNSMVKAEAQFMIAQAIEKNENRRAEERAIKEYKACAERYPESQYAGISLAKLIDYYINQRDYMTASDMLDQVFQDYPDAEFLDSMLLKWVLVSYRMGDFQKAAEKCQQLMFEYPHSSYAQQAKKILPKIEERLNR